MNARMLRTGVPRLAGCCSPLRARPAALEPTRRWHAPADRFLIATRRALIPAALVLGVAAGLLANELPGRYATLPAVVYFVTLGGWCSLNFARCREAHCLITGTGFNALAVAALIAAALDRNWYDPLSMTIVPVLVAGFVFESAWSRRHGNRTLRSDRNVTRDEELDRNRSND